MRLVSWNMNQCFRDATHKQAWAFLPGLRPDVALLQETELPPVGKAVWREIPTNRGGWGIAVVSWGPEVHELPRTPLDHRAGHAALPRATRSRPSTARCPTSRRSIALSRRSVPPLPWTRVQSGGAFA
jgi:hypothetical protein